MNGCVYIHINKENGKVYVGQTINISSRWRSGYKQQAYFCAAIRKHGWNNFEHVIVADDISGQKKLDNLEKLWIILLRATERHCGYNLVPGGASGSSEFGRMGGIAANRNPENRNRLKRCATAESRSRGGLIGGQKCVETGHILELGRIQGKKNKDGGHWGRIRVLGEAFARDNGKTQGRKNLESGHLKRLDQGHKNAAKIGYMGLIGRLGGKKGGIAANHLRWHINRGIVNPSCSLCIK